MAFLLTQEVPLQYGTATDPYFLFISRLGENIRQTRETAADSSRTFSYRGFNVGGMLAAATPEAGLYQEFDAGNTKVSADKDKRCAELKLVSLRQKSGLQRTVGLVIAATSDETLISSVLPTARPTLFPCDECVHLLGDDPTVADETLIVTTGLEGGMYEVHTFADIIAYHRNPFEHDERLGAAPYLYEGDTDKKAALYLRLFSAEKGVPLLERRSAAYLARLALLSEL